MDKKSSSVAQLKQALDTLKQVSIDCPVESVRPTLQVAIQNVEKSLHEISDVIQRELLPKPEEGQLRFLFAMDNQILKKIIQSMIVKRGHFVDSTFDTENAIEILENKDFDIVITDMTFPEPKSVSALEKLRVRDQDLQRHTPVIALTKLTPAEIAIDEWVGLLDAFVNAPLSEEGFFNIVHRVLARSATWS